MFTGIIEAFARVNTLTQEGDNLNIELESALARELKLIKVLLITEFA